MRPVVPVAVAALALAPVAGAARHAPFGGDVCKFVPAAKVAAIDGVSAKCTNGAPSAGLGSKISIGNWAGKTKRSPSLQVTIASYTDTGALQLGTRNLKQGLPGGTPKPLKGIGTAAFEATAAFETGIHFAVGKYIVYMSLGAVGANPPVAERKELESLAKSLAAVL